MHRPPKKKHPHTNPALPAEYFANIKAIAQRARAWITAHPTAQPLVQFNYTKETFLITDISTALAKHYVTVNDDGRAMLTAACPKMGTDDEPSVAMVRAAMEFLDDIAPRPMRCPSCNVPIEQFMSWSAPGKERPHLKPGAMLICVGCLAINVLCENRTVRTATEEEQAQVLADSAAGAVIEKLREQRARRTP